MMMTVPSATDQARLRACSREDSRDDDSRRPAPAPAGLVPAWENARAMTDQGKPAGLQPVPGTARGRGRIIVDLSDVVDRGTRRRAGVFRRALRREASRLRDPRRIAAVVLLSLVFAMILSGLIARGDAGGADARAYWAGRPDLAQRRGPVPPDRPVPAVRLRALDAAALRALGAPAVGRRLVRLAGRDDPAPALDDPLGLPAATADDGGHRGRPRLPVRGEPRHRQHQPAADADALGGAVHGSAAGRAAVGARDLDEMGAGRVPADPARARETVGPRLAGGLDRAQRR